VEDPGKVRPRSGRPRAARRAAVGEVKSERSEPFTSQQDLQATIAPATFLGTSGQDGEKEKGKVY